MALEGRFGDHHAVMCRLHLDHIDYLEKTSRSSRPGSRRWQSRFEPPVTS